MYRIINLRSLSLSRVQKLSFFNNPENCKLTLTENTCILCNKLGKNLKHVSYQSTFTNPSMKTKKLRKKRNKSNKKYAELLVVSDYSTSEQKATIQKLHPSDLKLLALTNLNLSELYKLKDFTKKTIFEEHTYNNLTIIENAPSIDVSLDLSVINNQPVEDTSTNLEVVNVIDENVPEIENVTQTDCTDVVEMLPRYSNFQPEIIEEEHHIPEQEDVKEKIEPKWNSKKIDLKAKEEIISRTLAAYLEVCASLRSLQRGLNTFNFHRHKAKKPNEHIYLKMKDIKIYNAILKGFAAKGDMTKLQHIIECAKEDEVKLNLQSYIAIFECLGRVNCKNSHLKQIRTYTKECLRQGITFNKIMNTGIFLSDQRSKVLEAMQSYDPNYNPTYDDPNLQYKNHLLDHLNHQEQLKQPHYNKELNKSLFTKESLETMISNQIDIEKIGYVTVKSIEVKAEPTAEVLKYREAFMDLIKTWEQTAYEAFNRDLSTLSARRGNLTLEPYMRSIPVKDFIAIIVDEAKKIAQGSETYSPTVGQLYRELGHKVYTRFKVIRKQKIGVLDKVLKIHSNYCQLYSNDHQELGVLPSRIDYLNTRQKWQWMEHNLIKVGATIKMDHQEWVPSTLQNIGKFLYHIVMHDLKIDVNCMRNNNSHKNYLPAFYTIFRHQGRIVKEEVKPHPVLSKLYRASVPETLTFPAYEVPMRCPPIPWISVQTGGYLISPCDMVRLPPQARAQKQRLEETSSNDIYPSLDSLNQLACVPWKVNKNILDVILHVFQSGGSSRLDVPEPPSALSPPPPVTSDMDKAQKFQNFKKKLQYRRKKGEMYSLWCDCLYRLSLANHFKDDIFWLPHNMDFRGRVYPIPPHLNHLGSDLARSMLVFAESRPLGPTGLDWLKLHLINLTGIKKNDPIAERLSFANEIMDKILDSADNPLDGRKWWAESDEPWQTLACCMEIAQAVRSDNPEEFRSHFPVHQDGSCNGLQHYAALGRDSAGALSVNLTPTRIPQDVYSAVVVLVEARRHKDAENGLEIARVLDGFVKRKVIKQTVMTTVYGVTRYGARLQIARQLKDIDNFPKEHVWAASSYLTSRTFDSLRTMFTSTREIQDWFTECARLISSVCSRNVEWITPLGLPIVQPYFRYKSLGTYQVYEAFQIDKYEKPNVMKQKNAFPPNFIHSLDSSHMMLTSLHCERAGITFVSVHDCYWTHPSTVHIMNKICREQFVALHSEPILENLSVMLTELYSYSDENFTEDGSVTDLSRKKLNRILRKLPKTGDFDIKKVLESVYFFS